MDRYVRMEYEGINLFIDPYYESHDIFIDLNDRASDLPHRELKVEISEV